jgi:HEAT repeat protein
LRDADATVRRRAEQGLAALARLVQPTWQPVLDFLASSEPAYRQWAAVRLAAAGAVAVPLLIPALAKNRPVEERLAALDALRRLGPLAGAAAPIVLDCLDDDEADVRKLVPGALAAFGGAAVPVLTAALRRPKPLVRHGALVALAQCRAADAGPALVAHLVATPEVVEQHLAAEALAGCGPAGLAALQHALGQHPVRCLTALAQMPEVPAALLAPHLHAPTAPVRLAAVLAVGRTQRTELAPNVLACLDDEEPVADVAALALAQLDAPTVAAELAQRVQTAATAPARRRAVAALGTGANARQHVAALLAVATDADVQVRRQTLSTLASLAATQAEAVYAVLLAALDDADGLVRTHAINGLAGLGTRGEPALRTALHKPDARLRRTAWPALLALQPGDADELLNSALTGRDCALACAALTALGQRRERLAVTTVNAAVASPLRDLRQTALATLHVWDATGNLAGAGLVEAFAAADPRVRLWALQAAEQVPPLALVEAVPVLTLLGGDWGTAANQAQKLLRKIGPAALPGFRSVLTSKEAKVRNRGLDTLRQFNWSAWYDLNHHAKHLHNPPADVSKKLDRVL